MPDEEKEVVEAITKAIDLYKQTADNLRVVLIIFGTVGIAAALFVTAFAGADFIKSDDAISIRIAAFIAALCLTALTAFNVQAKGNNARNAFRHLNHAYLMYRIGRITVAELVKAKDDAEKIIGSVDFQTSIHEKPVNGPDKLPAKSM
ncbi:MAG: hypothetical protein INR73_14345 [Williamsia sp.]|nr:hypothetical protein [Williamsia sp.]